METRKHYTKEFKLDAISLVLDQGFTIAEAARSLEIRANMLGRWVRVTRSMCLLDQIQLFNAVILSSHPTPPLRQLKFALGCARSTSCPGECAHCCNMQSIHPDRTVTFRWTWGVTMNEHGWVVELGCYSPS